MNSSSMREESASAWLCLLTTVPEDLGDAPRPAARRPGSASTGSPRRSASASTSPGTGAGPSVPPEGQGRGAHRVQPLDQRPAVGRVGRRQPCAEDDEHVGAGTRRAGRTGRRRPCAGPRGRARRRRRRPRCRRGRAAGGPPRRSGPCAPASSSGRPAGVSARRLGDSPIPPERHRAVTVRWTPRARHHPGSPRVPFHVVVQVATPQRSCQVSPDADGPFLATSAIRGHATRRISSRPRSTPLSWMVGRRRIPATTAIRPRSGRGTGTGGGLAGASRRPSRRRAAMRTVDQTPSPRSPHTRTRMPRGQGAPRRPASPRSPSPASPRRRRPAPPARHGRPPPSRPRPAPAWPNSCAARSARRACC